MTEPEGKTYPLLSIISGLYKVILISEVIMEEGKDFSFVSGYSSSALPLLFLNVDVFCLYAKQKNVAM